MGSTVHAGISWLQYACVRCCIPSVLQGQLSTREIFLVPQALISRMNVAGFGDIKIDFQNLDTKMEYEVSLKHCISLLTSTKLKALDV